LLRALWPIEGGICGSNQVLTDFTEGTNDQPHGNCHRFDVMQHFVESIEI
jgi:hypothetical protein